MLKVKNQVYHADFDIFIGPDGGIDGLVHLSDISRNVAGEEAVREYKRRRNRSSCSAG